MQLPNKISHVSSDEHTNKQHPNVLSQNLIMTNVVINTTTYVKYKVHLYQNIKQQQKQILSQK